tara:strand:+ start:4370 stop:4528 length:159 start_codon:yes stop_codon:yes gene_type:complete
MNKKNKPKKGEKLGVDPEKTDKDETEPVVNEELIRWMTEGTNPNVAPRSDCG